MRLSEDFLDNIGSTDRRAASDLAGEITEQRPLTTNDRRDILTPEYNLAFTTTIYYKYIESPEDYEETMIAVRRIMNDVARIINTILENARGVEAYSPVLVSHTLGNYRKDFNQNRFILNKTDLFGSSLYMTVAMHIGPESASWNGFMKTMMMLMRNIYRYYTRACVMIDTKMHDCQFIFGKIENARIVDEEYAIVWVANFTNKSQSIHWRELLKMSGYPFIDILMDPLKDYIEKMDKLRDNC